MGWRLSLLSLVLAGMLKSSLASPATAAAALKDLNFWHVLAWLLPLGLYRLKPLPREWVMSSFITDDANGRDTRH